MVEGEITRLLVRWSEGDDEALSLLYPAVEGELKRLARGFLRKERSGATALQPTELVSELFTRLLARDTIDLRCRAQFFAVAAEAMHRCLVDEARKRLRQKRFPEAMRIDLAKALGIPEQRELGILALNDALSDLRRIDPLQFKIVQFRFFAGLTHDDLSRVLDVPVARVRKEWSLAKLWLFRELKRGNRIGESE